MMIMSDDIKGTMTLSIMTLSKSIQNVTLSITTFGIFTLETVMLSVIYAECHK